MKDKKGGYIDKFLKKADKAIQEGVKKADEALEEAVEFGSMTAKQAANTSSPLKRRSLLSVCTKPVRATHHHRKSLVGHGTRDPMPAS